MAYLNILDILCGDLPKGFPHIVCQNSSDIDIYKVSLNTVTSLQLSLEGELA